MPKDVVKANTNVRDQPTNSHIASLSAVPTPGGAEVVFSLSGPATVTGRVLSISGRPVRTICRAHECQAGTNTLVWNAQADNGLAVPNGTYLVELAAATPEGTKSRALASVRIGR
jgi:hypothetical protein